MRTAVATGAGTAGGRHDGEEAGMARRLLLVALVAGIVTAIPGVAFAKGEMQAVQGQAVITGPGLPKPVELTGELSGSEGFLWGSDSASEFSTFVTATPLMSGDASAGWFELTPDDPASLGPAYSVRYLFEYQDGTVSNSEHVLYPYAPGGPLLHVPADQGLLGRHMDLWWRASSGTMVHILRARGLPAQPPAIPAAPPAPAAAAPDPAPVDAGWIWAPAAACLLALVLASVVWGRRRRDAVARVRA
jgi:hypothetical protein